MPGRRFARARRSCSYTRASSTRARASSGASTRGSRGYSNAKASARSTTPSAAARTSSRRRFKRKVIGGGGSMTTVTAGAASAKEKLIVALDVDSAEEARRLFEMMRRAAEATSEEAARLGVIKPWLIGVTVLPGADARTLEETGVSAESVEA